MVFKMSMMYNLSCLLQVVVSAEADAVAMAVDPSRADPAQDAAAAMPGQHDLSEMQCCLWHARTFLGEP